MCYLANGKGQLAPLAFFNPNSLPGWGVVGRGFAPAELGGSHLSREKCMSSSMERRGVSA